VGGCGLFDFGKIMVFGLIEFGFMYFWMVWDEDLFLLNFFGDVEE
jgi:hypothetical protein